MCLQHPTKMIPWWQIPEAGERKENDGKSMFSALEVIHSLKVTTTFVRLLKKQMEI